MVWKYYLRMLEAAMILVNPFYSRSCKTNDYVYDRFYCYAYYLLYIYLLTYLYTIDRLCDQYILCTLFYELTFHPLYQPCKLCPIMLFIHKEKIGFFRIPLLPGA